MIVDFQPADCETTHFCCRSCPACGALLRHPESTHARSACSAGPGARPGEGAGMLSKMTLSPIPGQDKQKVHALVPSPWPWFPYYIFLKMGLDIIPLGFNSSPMTLRSRIVTYSFSLSSLTDQLMLRCPWGGGRHRNQLTGIK